MRQPCEPNSHDRGKNAVVIPFGTAANRTKLAVRPSAKLLTQATNDQAPAPIAAMRACERFAERSQRSARAAENITALGEMTRGIAHDFRNVLAMLTSGLNIAEASADDPAELKLALAAMQEGVGRGLKMTNRLLAFARQQEMKPGLDDINALLTAMKPFLSYGAGPGIRVVLKLAAVLRKCLVDPPQLNAAILNLIVNARDAMPDGGVVRISTREVSRRSGRAGGDYVRVRVRDSGAGMPRDVLARIFDPFFTTKGDGGTGLGLPQVLTSMRQVGGEIRVHSIVGKGTTFDLFFPIHEDAPVVAPDDWRQLDQWADEGGAIVAPPTPHAGS
jgi:signal transduction histidine kinase